MPIQLRDYQNTMIGGARDALRRAQRVLLQAPTGAGKTVLAAYMIGQTSIRGESAWFLCHRAELVQQTSLTLSRFDIAHGIIAAGYAPLPAPVQVCSIDTLKNRLETLTAPRVAVVDEAHHSSAAGWARVIKWLTDAGTLIIGLSATPQRLDGVGLAEHFDAIVLGPAVAWLIEHGHLSPYMAFIPDVPDMRGVRRSMGDYSRSESAEKMSKPKLTGNIIHHWRTRACGKRTVGFAVNVAHSRHLADSFCAAGIPAAHLDGGTDKRDRRRIIEQYAAGELQVLFNVSLFGEGFDLSAIAQTDVTIDCVIDAAPTQSLALALQRWGRALRPAPGKTAVLLDHAGNMLRHGFPDDERTWSLAGIDRKAANDNSPPPPVICEGCFNAIRRPLPPACPHCGKSLKAKQQEIEVAEGELRAADEAARESVRAKLKREEQRARSIDELAAIYARRGVSNPIGRAVAEFGSFRFRRHR